MENFIYFVYDTPFGFIVLSCLVCICLLLIFTALGDTLEKHDVKKENELLKRDLSYCKQFMSNKNFKRYRFHRQFDVELEQYLSNQKNYDWENQKIKWNN